jgi:hypothetical protein
METLIDRHLEHGLDALCRTIVSIPYRNTMHATNPFMEANQHLLMPVMALNPRTGREVNGAQLTSFALDQIAIPKQKDMALRTERSELIQNLVHWIETEPFQPQYRQQSIGRKVVGWQARLNAYFWPSPNDGYNATVARIKTLTKLGSDLAQTVDTWDEATGRLAVKWANDVLQWGRVPQREVSPEIVRAVIQAALTGNYGRAPMNSGWTKVAAFATAHLEEEGRAHAIWDSRVSWSLVRRADALLYESDIRAVPKWLAGIGKVPGRGGTRWKHELHLHWPYAYGSWRSHIAATELIRDIRDVLRIERGGLWTIRTVEMVLFMDGY